jgi:uncharacterized protein (UPF0261 family)
VTGAAPRVAVLATLDTKGAEACEAARLLRECGADPVVVDAGVGPPRGCPPDVRLAAATRGMRRDAAMAALGEAARDLLADWCGAGRLQGVMGLGGNQGTAICGIALRGLPHGLPRVLVSTVAAADVRAHVEDADVFLVNPVADLVGGPNAVNLAVLANAARALAAMARAYRPAFPPAPDGGAPGGHGGGTARVAISAFGNTQPAVEEAMRLLREAGREGIAFHASGTGGPAIERLVGAGLFGAVLDLTPHELLAEIFPEDAYRPVRPGRLLAAGRRGIPVVLAPGGLNYFCFGPPESIPAAYRGRPTHHHNPYNTNVRATAAECARVGEELARRLNAARGPSAVLLPTRGWSEISRAGGPLYDPQADEAMVEALLRRRRQGVHVERVDAHINDPGFARRAVELLLELMRGRETS